MNDRNICRFVSEGGKDLILTHNFVFESNPETMSNTHVQKHHVAFLFCGGEGCVLINDKQLRVKSGDLLFCFTGERFRVGENQGLEYMYISFSGSRADSLFVRFGIRDDKRHFEGFDGILPLWKESVSRAGEGTSDLLSESMLLFVFSRLGGSNGRSDSLIDQIVRLTAERFREPEFSLSGVAEELGYNAKYLSHLFKDRMKMNYTEYLRTVRVNHAVMLFDHGIESVKNVAVLSGFSDPLYFSTVFKKIVGDTPAEYRKTVGKNEK